MSASDYPALLREYGPMIQRVLRAYEADAGVREDLAQDVALAIWRALPSYRGEARMKTFVARIAHNIAVSNVRKRIRAPLSEPLSEELGDNATARQLEQRSAYGRLLQSVQQLPLSYRQAVTLALEGFSAAEIADALDISEGAAAVRLSRARALLAEMMRDND